MIHATIQSVHFPQMHQSDTSIILGLALQCLSSLSPQPWYKFPSAWLSASDSNHSSHMHYFSNSRVHPISYTRNSSLQHNSPDNLYHQDLFFPQYHCFCGTISNGNIMLDWSHSQSLGTPLVTSNPPSSSNFASGWFFYPFLSYSSFLIPVLANLYTADDKHGILLKSIWIWYMITCFV